MDYREKLSVLVDSLDDEQVRRVYYLILGMLGEAEKDD